MLIHSNGSSLSEIQGHVVCKSLALPLLIMALWMQASLRADARAGCVSFWWMSRMLLTYFLSFLLSFPTDLFPACMGCFVKSLNDDVWSGYWIKLICEGPDILKTKYKFGQGTIWSPPCPRAVSCLSNEKRHCPEENKRGQSFTWDCPLAAASAASRDGW